MTQKEMTTISMGEWAAVHQAAEVLGKTRNGIYWMIDHGKLTSQRLGIRAILVSRDSIVAELRQQGKTVSVEGDQLVIREARE